MRLVAWARQRNPLPVGTASVGVGLAVTGVASLAFLVGTDWVLGPQRYGQLVVLWGMVFFLGPGFFVPLEQEVGRALSARRALGLSGGAVIRRAATLGAGLAGVLILVCLAAHRFIIDELFSGDVGLFVALLVAIGGYCVANLVEGAMSGSGQFGRYSLYLGGEAVLRLVVVGVMILIGAKAAGPYGLALGIAPFLAVLLIARGQRPLFDRGPEAPWRELTLSLGALLTGSVLSQFIVNAGPILVQLLSHDDEQALVGAFGAALTVARVPLFLFQAVQAALLPGLSAQAATGDLDRFEHGMRRLLLLLVAMTAVGTAVAALFGPWVVAHVFGSGYVVSSTTTGLLGLGSAMFVIAMAMAHANIALGGARAVAGGWAVGAVAFILVVLVVPDLLLRVELGYVAASSVAAAAMGLLLVRNIRAGARITEGDLLEALLD